MKPKTVLTFVLLTFVAVSVIATIAKEARHVSPPSAERARQANNTATPGDELAAEGLVAVYFHGNVRCPTCRSIESYAHDTIASQFSDDLAAGRLSWRVMNYELPENAEFVNEFQLVAPSVVLVARRNRLTTRWENLDRVWELVGDRPAFAAYIQEEVKKQLAGP